MFAYEHVGKSGEFRRNPVLVYLYHILVKRMKVLTKQSGISLWVRGFSTADESHQDWMLLFATSAWKWPPQFVVFL